jgi:hypothetical protein
MTQYDLIGLLSLQQDPIDIKATTKTKVSRLIRAWSETKGVSESSIRLIRDGSRLKADQTLADVCHRQRSAKIVQAGVKDGDQIDVFIEQQGGFFY